MLTFNEQIAEIARDACVRIHELSRVSKVYVPTGAVAVHIARIRAELEGAVVMTATYLIETAE